MSQTPMVLPRTHLGSSQNSKSEAICPGLEIQTKSILCTLAFQPNPYGSSQNSSWVIPDLNAWGNQSKTGIWTKLKLCTLSSEPSPMVLPKTHPAFPRSYCFRKSAIDLAKDQSQYFVHWLMSQTPMVLPRTHLGSSQNSKSEDICPGLQTQTKSYFAHWLMSQTPMVLPRTHLGSSQISMSEEISPRLKCKQSKNFAHCPMSQALWFFQKLIQLFPEAIVSENLP